MALFFILVIGVIAGFLASNIASDKGHDGSSWFFAGFLFGPLGLIAAAGLSDRKLRKYIRQIGEKQEAIEPGVEYQNFGVVSSAKFELNKDATEDQIWEKIMEAIGPNSSKQADRIKSNLINQPFGGKLFTIVGLNGKLLAKAKTVDSGSDFIWEIEIKG